MFIMESSFPWGSGLQSSKVKNQASLIIKLLTMLRNPVLVLPILYNRWKSQYMRKLADTLNLVNQNKHVTSLFQHSADILLMATCLTTPHVMGWVENLIHKQFNQGSNKPNEERDLWVVSPEKRVFICWSNREFLSLGHRAEGWQDYSIRVVVVVSDAGKIRFGMK